MPAWRRPQVSALQKAFAGPHNSKGDLVYPMNAFDAGITALLPSSTPPAAGAAAPPMSIDVDQRLFNLLGNPLEAVQTARGPTSAASRVMAESSFSITA